MQFLSTVVYTDDVPRAVEFYQRGLGCTLRFLDVDVQLPGRRSGELYHFAILDAGTGELHVATHALGALLMPGYTRPPDGGPLGLEIAFYSDDVRVDFDRALAAGAVVVSEPRQMPWGQEIAYVRGVDGVFIAICSRPKTQLPGEEL